MRSQSRLIFGTEAIARMIGISRRTVANYIDRGLLPAIRLPSGTRRVRKSDLDKFVESLKIKRAS